MTQSLTIHGKEGNRTVYRRLLRSDWSVENLKRAIDLAFSLMSERSRRIIAPWRSPAGRNGKPASGRFTESTERVRRLLSTISTISRLGLSKGMVAESFADRVLRGEGKPERLALEAATLLLVGVEFEIEGSNDLYLDLQGLMCLMAVDSLLPLLKKSRDRTSHDFLVGALDAYVRISWVDRPDEKYFLMSVLASYLGDKKSEESSLRVSLSLCDSEAHEYVTKVQAYWTFLMNEGRTSDAIKVLLDAYRAASKRDLEEIRDLIAATPNSLPASIR